ncbi:ParM/StbA family protein [Alicyclobacillus ferrooxydans]|uniref:Actin-like protein N-terminal domain-containing protein n=1 Tax=Alicyclobacillus ferrooxydans TaxID=471514 RepID=A0A0P9EY62_9BACL|nr:ParM/StbA family protein [Alicyclobacillus ferrooxydans]KPV44076.1 hypothetical protein AN477_08325 [Alicyclobacillus ferrooxydans]
MSNSHVYAVVVDSGKHFSKALSYKDGGFIKTRFRTLVEDATHVSGVELFGDTYRVEFDDKQYLIGSMLSERNADFHVSKHSLSHKLAIYTSIALILEKMGIARLGIPALNLAVNCPINIFKNQQLKSEYRDYILNEHKPICLRVNGQAWVFRINALVLLPEGVGSIYTNLDKYRNSRVTVIDIGSLNTSFCTFDHLIPKLDSMLISDLGVNLLRGYIQDTLSSRFGQSVSLDESEAILHEGAYSLNGAIMLDSKSIFTDLKMAHVKHIADFAVSHGLSLNSPVFCGGGALLLKDQIIERFPHAKIDENGSYSNVMSYWKLLEARGLTHV